MAARMPLPIAVRRPVVRLDRVSRSACWSVVGGWTTAAKPLKATIPICVVALCRLMKSAAAASAASSRLGGMSVEHMLPETSIVRMIVVSFAGKDRIAAGRARATTSEASPRRNRATGRWRRRNDPRGAASRTSDRLE